MRRLLKALADFGRDFSYSRGGARFRTVKNSCGGARDSRTQPRNVRNRTRTYCRVSLINVRALSRLAHREREREAVVRDADVTSMTAN